jgi:hypothetical protein
VVSYVTYFIYHCFVKQRYTVTYNINALATLAVVTLAPKAIEAAKRHVRYMINTKSMRTRRHEKSVRTWNTTGGCGIVTPRHSDL